MNHIALGELGQKAAVDYLISNGYTIVTEKYRTKIGEIDIIARKNDILAFIEVKTRRNNLYGSPAEAVTYRKQRKIISTAHCYLKQSGQMDCRCRCDILEVMAADRKQLIFNHITNAFGE